MFQRNFCKSMLLKSLMLSVVLSAIVLLGGVFSSANAEDPPVYVSQFGTYGTGNGQMYYPHDIAINSSGNIWVTDTFNHRIQKLSSSGTYLSQFGTSGTGNGQFAYPNNITIDSMGNLWIADGENHRIQKFSSAGIYLSQFGSYGTGNGQFNLPTGIAFDSSGNMFVVDSGNSRIQKFSSSGAYLSKFGTSGNGNGQLNSPWGIAIDSSGNIFVADRFNHRIQKFNSAGIYLSQFGGYGAGNGQFNQPLGIVIDGSGNIYVTEYSNHRVQKFNSAGIYLSQFGTSGNGNGQFYKPVGITIDSSGNIFVADHGNSRIQKFAYATNCNAVTEIPVSECQELLSLYNNTNGPNWTNKTGWNQTNTPCSWYAVTCSAGHVTEINLAYNQLSGSIPNFTNLPNLESLTLDGNQLSGSIPNFTNLPNLQILGLGSNQLSGSIPNFSNLPNLTQLSLYRNQLSGSIPNLNLPNLTTFHVSNNQLTGSIPDFNLPKLQSIQFYDNQLSGNIPDFKYLYSLLSLVLGDYASGNQLTGSIPDFKYLPKLQFLSLGHNQLSGSIPNFSNLPNLQSIEFPYNQLSGSIPNFSNLPNLSGLALHSNQLSGSIPNFSNLPKLNVLTLSNNQLCGSIPKFTAFNLSNLYYAKFNNNCGLTASDDPQKAMLDSKDSIWQQRNPNCPAVSACYASVKGTAWYDSNANGVQDAGEAVSDKTVACIGGSPVSTKSTTTDSNGQYMLSDLSSGQYTCYVSNIDSGWKVVFPATSSYALTLQAGEQKTADFGSQNQAIRSISGTVFEDLNGNCIKDANENGLSMQLVSAKLNQLDPLVEWTDSNGNYKFADMVWAGNYTVSLNLDNGWIQTCPNLPAYYELKPPYPNDGVQNVNFGVMRVKTLTVSKAGNGTGTVTSNPAGITCGADCTEDYILNTQVTLTATASAGSVFTGWGGGVCSGTGTCQITMSQTQNVTANFVSSSFPKISVNPTSLSLMQSKTGMRDTRTYVFPSSSHTLREPPPDLFREPVQRDSSLSQAQNELMSRYNSLIITIESKVVQVNSDLFGTAESLNLNLFGQNYVAFRTKIEERASNDFSWYGSIDDGQDGSAVFVVQGENLSGTVRAGGGLYAIRTLGNRLYVLIRQNEAAFPPEAESQTHGEESPESMQKRDSTLSDDGSVITVLVAYTKAAAQSAGNISSLIQLAVDEANQSYQNSGIRPRLSLVYSYQVSYTESVDFTTDLNRMRSKTDGYMDEIHGLRDTYAADIVVLLINGFQYCGLASAVNYTSNPDYGFCVVAQSCATGYYSFAHEIGHLQGARHNPEADPSSPFPYGHGYLNKAKSWRTIMAYANEGCADGSCRRINYWSNPDISYGGLSMGTASTHNNARVLNETAFAVSNFRSTKSQATLTIQNVGDNPLTISAITKTQNWLTLSAYPALPFSIAPGASQTVNVDITWALVSSTQDMITITSNDPTQPSLTVPVTVTPISPDVIPALSVIPDYREVDTAGGTNTFIVDNIGDGSMNWTASTTDSWLHIVSGSGVNHGAIMFSYDANTGDPRTGKITISAFGALGSPVAVEIRQSMMGDIDNKGTVDLADAILVLQTLAGLNPAGVNVGADINGDGKIGIEEVVYILQKVAGLR